MCITYRAARRLSYFYLNVCLVMVSYGEYFEEREVVSDDLGGDRVGECRALRSRGYYYWNVFLVIANSVASEWRFWRRERWGMTI